MLQGVIQEPVNPKVKALTFEQRELALQWSELRGHLQRTRNPRLKAKLQRVESEIKGAIKQLEQQIRAEAQNKFYEGAR